MPIVELLSIAFLVTTVVVLTIVGIGRLAEEEDNQRRRDSKDQYIDNPLGGLAADLFNVENIAEQQKRGRVQATSMGFWANLLAELTGKEVNRGSDMRNPLRPGSYAPPPT